MPIDAPPSPSPPPRLITRMREAIRLRHYSYRTEQAYVDWVKRSGSAKSHRGIGG